MDAQARTLPSTFRWLPGMLTLAGWRVLTPPSRGYVLKSSPAPDLTDPATLGCLLALVREASGDSTACVVPDLDGIWDAWVNNSHVASGPTEGEALMMALRALAPSVER